MEITKEIRAEIKTWIDNLRSGKFTQTTKKLQDGNGFCCLGVACKVFIPDNLQQFCSTASNLLRGFMPDEQQNSPVWIKRINMDFKVRTQLSLSDLNDIGIAIDDHYTTVRFNFDEIADLLQAVYIEGVLDDAS